ncbi:hypothetical protein Y032_0030g2104 [Ancylostoma ceylanicum]|uniref:RRM domain-containing protein n=1 Tax=Ancylostoma ceylanicum TaxID=53326 RepID=A0A016UQ40_9BILA|nr:hypothetical protein Y032_0030g2104 [Ancylostoma ceylanicum]
MNYAAYATGAVPGPVGGVAEASAYASGAVPQAVPTQPYATAVPQMAATGTAIPSVYGEQRPTFSADGSGMPYSSMLSTAGSSVLNQDISYDTNSKDPVMVRSRVFIGRLTSAPVTRDDLITLFKPFGTILALNHFKQGFGFVQFSQPSEADAAVNGLNGKKWMGVIIAICKWQQLILHIVEQFPPFELVPIAKRKFGSPEPWPSY